MLGIQEYTLAREMVNDKALTAHESVSNTLKVYYTEVYIQNRWAHGKHQLRLFGSGFVE